MNDDLARKLACLSVYAGDVRIHDEPSLHLWSEDEMADAPLCRDLIRHVTQTGAGFEVIGGGLRLTMHPVVDTAHIAAARTKRARRLEQWLKAHAGDIVTGHVDRKTTRRLMPGERLVRRREPGELIEYGYPVVVD